jgi:hypothetical protein
MPKITPEFLKNMEDVLNLYEKPYDSNEPVLCFDEKSKQLIADTRPTQAAKEGRPKRRDYEYKRNGTRNIFVTVEPKGGYREVSVTKRRTKPDFAKEIRRIVDLQRYAKALKIHFVLDNLNTHFEKSLIKTFEKEEVERILARIQFHHTPKHASWLNMAEIEIGILDRQCIRGRIPSEAKLKTKIAAWNAARNGEGAKINWKFTVKEARVKFRYDGMELS